MLDAMFDIKLTTHHTEGQVGPAHPVTEDKQTVPVRHHHRPRLTADLQPRHSARLVLQQFLHLARALLAAQREVEPGLELPPGQTLQPRQAETPLLQPPGQPGLLPAQPDRLHTVGIVGF